MIARKIVIDKHKKEDDNIHVVIVPLIPGHLELAGEYGSIMVYKIKPSFDKLSLLK